MYKTETCIKNCNIVKSHFLKGEISLHRKTIKSYYKQYFVNYTLYTLYKVTSYKVAEL